MTRKHASVDIFGAVVVKYRGQGDSRAIFLLGTEYGRLLPVVRHALWRSSGFQGVALVLVQIHMEWNWDYFFLGLPEIENHTSNSINKYIFIYMYTVHVQLDCACP